MSSRQSINRPSSTMGSHSVSGLAEDAATEDTLTEGTAAAVALVAPTARAADTADHPRR
jgi:hypothetical protein